ncbi:MAG: hypothetical protein IT373_25630 [Polyangiaceae bacterium]|nr:hypothetical protein [Polyangiaceae bacterium]
MAGSVASAAACKKTTTSGGTGGSGATTTTTTTTTTTSTTSTTSTTTTTTTSGCAATVGNGDQACETCAQDSCCGELVDVSNNPNDAAAFNALVACVQNACLNGECFYQICDASAVIGGQDQAIGFFFANDTATCMGVGADNTPSTADDCCTETKACLADTSCLSCLLDGIQADCDATQLDEPVNACMTACQ